MDIPTAHFFRPPLESSAVMHMPTRSDFHGHVKCDGIRHSMPMLPPLKAAPVSCRWRKSEIKCVQSNAGGNIDDENVGDQPSLSTSIEQGKRIVALQKELLEQVSSLCMQSTTLVSFIHACIGDIQHM